MSNQNQNPPPVFQLPIHELSLSPGQVRYLRTLNGQDAIESTERYLQAVRDAVCCESFNVQAAVFLIDRALACLEIIDEQTTFGPVPEVPHVVSASRVRLGGG